MEGFDLIESLSRCIKRKSEGIAMVKIKVDEDACVGCGSCVEDCPNDVYELDQENGKTVVVKETDCMACLSCHEICPSQALEHDDIHVAKRLYIDRKVNKALNKII